MNHSMMDHSMMDHSMMNHTHHMMAGHDHGSMDHSMHNPVNDHSAHMNHDGAMHDHHSGHDMSGHMMMSMVFHGGCKEVILFSWWETDSVAGLIGSMFAIFLAAALYESLKYYRENLFWRTHNALQYRAVAVPPDGKRAAADQTAATGRQDTAEDGRIVHMVGEVIHKQPQHMLSWMNVLQTFLHAVQVTVSFLLMLVFMTYNYWLCLAVVAGASTGYFLFGWKKSVIVDVTEHCH